MKYKVGTKFLVNKTKEKGVIVKLFNNYSPKYIIRWSSSFEEFKYSEYSIDLRINSGTFSIINLNDNNLICKKNK